MHVMLRCMTFNSDVYILFYLFGKRGVTPLALYQSRLQNQFVNLALLKYFSVKASCD